jgi:phosphoglycolate phosphatase
LKYDLVAFDFDGTLADSFPWFVSVLDGLARRFDFRHATAEEKEAMRHMEARAILKLLGVPIWKAPVIVAYARRLMQQNLSSIRLFDGVAPALARIAAGGPALAVLSSNSLANVKQVLGPDTAALVRFFECGTDLFGKAAKIKRLLKHTGIEASRAILVGDELRDIDAARAAGIVAASVAWGYNHPAALEARGPDRLFRSVAELNDYFSTDRSPGMGLSDADIKAAMPAAANP